MNTLNDRLSAATLILNLYLGGAALIQAAALNREAVLIQSFVTIVVDIYRNVNRRCVYLALGIYARGPEGGSCFSIYQNIWVKMHFIFKETI